MKKKKKKKINLLQNNLNQYFDSSIVTIYLKVKPYHEKYQPADHKLINNLENL